MKSRIPLFRFCLITLMGLLLPGCNFSVYSQTPANDTEKKASPPEHPVGLEQNGVLIVYPAPNSTINAARTFLVGKDSNSEVPLFSNGKPIRKNGRGFFAEVVNLNNGENEFKLTRSNGQEVLAFKLHHPLPVSALSSHEQKILTDSISPAENIGVTAGDIIHFSMRATPGCKASVNLAGKIIELRQLCLQSSKSYNPNFGQATAFGHVYQNNEAAPKDVYFGYYKVSPQDHFQDLKPIYTLSSTDKTISQTAPHTISVVDQPILLRTSKNDTITRAAPDAARLTPLPEGVLFLADGWYGPWWRLELATGNHIWIAKNDMQLETGVNCPPAAKITTINLESNEEASRLVVPLNERLPFQLQQELKPNKIILNIYGATADTDFITPDLKNSNTDKVIDFITFKQPKDGLYELTVNLKAGQQWGYWADYEGTNLILHIKTSPPVAPDKSEKPLAGLRICLDPGHGGAETGSIGCSGVKESSLNLAITLKLKDVLQDMGAQVVLTRTANNYDVSLGDRVKTALTNHCHLLVSVHNNALPDGRDPWQERGTSTYWYHPQSQALARELQEACTKNLNFPNYGIRYQNLFVCRPSQLPAALVEVGFMINPDEYAELLDQKIQSRAAQGIAQGIKNFVLKSTSSSNNHVQRNILP